jgi:hypothetical protein
LRTICGKLGIAQKGADVNAKDLSGPGALSGGAVEASNAVDAMAMAEPL